MKFVPLAIEGVVVVEPEVFRDGRGFFCETYHAEKFRAGGIDAVFVQDNLSRSAKGALRGLHAQGRRPQGKLIRVVAGEIFDVAVDIRRGSPTYLKHVHATLSDRNGHAMWVPVGFAHGFCVLSDTADVEYKCTDVYDPKDEIRLRYDDPRLGIRWPTPNPILSPKDLAALSVEALSERFPAYAPPVGR